MQILRTLLIFSFLFVKTNLIVHGQDVQHNLNLDSIRGKFSVHSISFKGNTKTKSQIIVRELMFEEKDSVTLPRLAFLVAQSKNNLINTSLFNFVDIETLVDKELRQVYLTVNVKERWYFWPRPILQIQDRNFNAWWETKDLYRLNYGMYTSIYNIGGRAETFKLFMRKGYTDLLGMTYHFPYLTKKQNIGLMVSARYQENKEIAFSTLKNKQQFYRDPNRASRKETDLTAGIIFRGEKFSKHFFDFSFRQYGISDTVAKLNPEYFEHSSKNLAFFCLRYAYRLDLRDSKVFPLEGKLLEFSLEKDGLGLLNQENINELVLSAGIKQYSKLANRVFASGSVKIRHRMNAVNYYSMNTALGFQDYVKGYEYFVIEGQTFALTKVNLAYQLLKPSVKKVHVKKFKKFSEIPYALYVSTHFDAAYVNDRYSFETNILANKVLMGSGLSFTFVTYYDYVLRLDYSINRFAQKGFFLHFNAPI